MSAGVNELYTDRFFFMEKQFYKMRISYRGSAYNGWQSQPDGNAVQDFLERALRGLHQDSDLRVNGCSRTDKGVHALGQMAAYKAFERRLLCLKIAFGFE